MRTESKIDCRGLLASGFVSGIVDCREACFASSFEGGFFSQWSSSGSGWEEGLNLSRRIREGQGSTALLEDFQRYEIEFGAE